jgi:hypothetical protein
MKRYPNKRCPKTLPHLGLQLTESVRAKSPVRLARKQMILGRK